jgi:tetratricopeptide (TPR) repeat protein
MTIEEIRREHRLLRSDPKRYLEIVESRLAQNPSDPDAYFDRHFAWTQLGQREDALRDLDTAINLDPTRMILFFSRANILHALGRYENAIEDFNKAFALDTDNWFGSVGALFRADCYARLGNEAAALADAAQLPDDHWMPRFAGLPGGDKSQIIAELRQRAAAAGRGQT